MHPVSDLVPPTSSGASPAAAASAAPFPAAGAAYRVPWAVERRDDPRFLLVNTSDEELHGVHLVLTGAGRLLWTRPLRVEPGGRIAFVLHADDPARDCVVCVRWFRPDGGEYVWRIVF